jgi:small-conductance mechanosensitive channel
MPGLETAFHEVSLSVQSVFTLLLNRLIIAAIILLVGFIAGRLLGNLLRRLLREVGLDNVIKTAGIKISLERLFSGIVTYGIYIVAVIMALNTLKLDALVLDIIAAAVILVIAASVLLAVKDFIPNFLAGIRIGRKGMLKEGDHVVIDGIDAKVLKKDLTDIKLQSKKGDVIFVPNSVFIKKKFVRRKR